MPVSIAIGADQNSFLLHLDLSNARRIHIGAASHASITNSHIGRVSLLPWRFFRPPGRRDTWQLTAANQVVDVSPYSGWREKLSLNVIFINLPVRDLEAATRFYEAIGCTKNAQFSNDDASSMVWSDTITFQLMTHAYYSTFTHKPIADAHRDSGMLLALSRDSRADVDQIVMAASTAGGKGDPRPTQDLGFLYVRTFEDLDGHLFEPAFMDPSAIPAGA